MFFWSQVIVTQASVQRCSAVVDFLDKDKPFFPPTINNPELHDFFAKVGSEMVGPNNVREKQPLMGAEDFSFYSQAVPAGFYYVGVRNETLGSVHTGHSLYFMIDEDVLPTGAAVHAAVAERYLAGGAEQHSDQRSPEQEL